MLLVAPAHAAAPDSSNSIEMFVGEARVLPVSPTRIAIGNGKIISASSVAKNQLLVLAEGGGTTTLHLWLKGGAEKIMTVKVREANLQSTLDDINRLLSGVENVKARIAGSKIVLEGDMVSDTNQARAQQIQKMYDDSVINFVGKVGWEKMIYLDVKVLELTTKGSRDLGIRWDSDINGPHAGTIADFYSNDTFRYLPSPEQSRLQTDGALIPNKLWPPQGFINLSTLITSRINLLVQDGEAQVLAAPSLSTRSGSKARFVAGGEIPLPVSDGFGQTRVEFKEYGVILDVTPVSDDSGAIYAKVDVEVSSLDRSVTVLGIPGILKRKSTAEFNSKDGETVVLSGMYSYEGSKDVQKVPGMGDVPLLGGLFRNKNKVSATREVAIVITPRVVQATPNPDPGAKDLNKQKLYEFDKRVRDEGLLPKRPAPLTVTE
ncbi:pilus assembly protein CpaC [Massilia sp. CF038]|nr:pilus assembly protein CpaC [Massilia sp. CF038]